MLRIVLSNRYEVLEGALLARLDDAPASPFAADQVIVPSAAIRRKVELAIADRNGICANVEFPFLAQWLWREIGTLVPVAETSPFAPEILAWRVYGILGDARFVAEHPPLARYLAHADDRMRYELAVRVATLVEQYITYRPQWLAAWSAGREIAFDDAAAAAHQRWQAALWRRIAVAVDARQRHPSLAFFAAIEAGAKLPAARGTRTHVFCVPSMPPLYLDIVRGLARFIDIDLYALNPCREYWFDIVDPKRLSWLAARGETAHHESGNRLLAAWGAPAKAFLSLLFDGTADDAAVDDAPFVAAAGATLLATLQNAILDLADPAPGSVVPDDPDRSVEVHVCHSRTRELETLHDRLLGLFAADPSLSAADVLVVTPDLAGTAPLIDAVFGNALPPRRIPYAITGRPRSEANPVAGALLAALALAPSRFPASAVYELLQRPVVARRFGLDEDALASIHRWIRVSGIRWGLDARARTALDLPAEARFTFDDGLDRLFAGYAWPADPAAPFEGRLPAGDAEGAEAHALGAFAGFVDALTGLRALAARRMTPGQWFDALHATLAALVAPAADDAEAMREVHVALARLRDDMTTGGSADEPLRLAVVQAALTATIEAPTRGGVPTGAVTFASMASLRGLPYRVVCAIGLDDGALPARTPRNELDLMQSKPAPGDRQRRLDDRNVLLDLLLAARDVLHLSYAGRSLRDNAPLPPATPVSELVDYLVPAIAGGADAARRRLIVTHPLQPFSPAAFDASTPRRQSFDGDYAEALRRRVEGDGARIVRAAGDEAADAADDDAVEAPRVLEAQAPFFAAPLAAPDAEWRSVPIERLLRFYRNPSRLLLTERLAIAIPETPEELADDEPFGRDYRAQWVSADRLLAQLRDGVPFDALRAIARAGVEYPPGPLGDALIDRELAQITAFTAAVAPDLAAATLPPVPFAFETDEGGATWRLEGVLTELRPRGLVRARYVNANARDYLDAWIWHLLLNALRPAAVEPCTVLHSRDGTCRLRPLASPADAAARMATLVRLHARGLVRPLPYFPRSSWAFVKGGGNLREARNAWNGNPQYAGESAEAAFALAFRGVEDPLGDAFEATALEVFDGFLDHLDDPRL